MLTILLIPAVIMCLVLAGIIWVVKTQIRNK